MSYYSPEPVDGVAENIMNERRGGPVDRNPTMKCEICNEGHKWQDYWKARINTPKDEFICDECLERACNWLGRFENNKSLKDYNDR